MLKNYDFPLIFAYAILCTLLLPALNFNAHHIFQNLSTNEMVDISFKIGISVALLLVLISSLFDLDDGIGKILLVYVFPILFIFVVNGKEILDVVGIKGQEVELKIDNTFCNNLNAMQSGLCNIKNGINYTQPVKLLWDGEETKIIELNNGRLLQYKVKEEALTELHQ